MTPPLVISLGGSVIVPDGPDSRFIRSFVRFIRRVSRRRRVFIITGGGATARRFVAAARQAGVRDQRSLHWIGVRACQLNAMMLQAAFGLPGEAVTDRSALARTRGRTVVVAPSVPGTTSDYGSVLVARSVGASDIINLSNVDGVYTADPRTHRHARRIPSMTWTEFRRQFSGRLKPGMHVPFDPVASRLAERLGFRVIVVGRNLNNLNRLISGRIFTGTRIGT